jgi:predicted anti-sigma-YlaC factor YlaD
MKHYDYVEWIFYKEKTLSDKMIQEMEEHLYECNECMDIFLSLINEEEIYKAEETISSDFTSCVIDSIQEIRYKPKITVKRQNTSFKNIFGYYVAVAAVTILLTFGGFYSGLVDAVPQVAKSTVIKDTINKPNIISNLSEEIVNRTSNFVNNFQIFNSREELK